MLYANLLLTLFFSLGLTGFGEEETTIAPEETTSSLLTGHWKVAETAKEKEQRLRAIDEVTARMGRFKRGRARERLSERTAPPRSLVIEIDGSKVMIESGGRRLELEVEGPPIEVSGSEGEAQMSAKMDGSQLIVVTRTDKAERRTAYHAGASHLSMEVTMTGDELDEALKYVSSYTRIE